MLRSYRFLVIAACGLAAIASLGTGAFLGALYAPHYGDQAAESAGRTAYPKQHYPSQIDRDRAGLPYFAERIASGPDPDEGSEREKRDLAAQEASALWAFWMLVVSALGVVATMIATGFLLWQIILTREAVEDTGNATNAMIRQNELTEQAQRPYLVVEAGKSPTEPNEHGQIMPASFRHRNFGGTAAQIILQAHKIEVIDQPNILPEPLAPEKGGRRVPSGEFVAPHDVTEFSPAGPIYNSHIEFHGGGFTVVPDPPIDLQNAFRPRNYTFFHGFVVYADFEGRSYIRGFCFTYEAGRFRLSHPSAAHNYDRRCNADGTPYDPDRQSRDQPGIT